MKIKPLLCLTGIRVYLCDGYTCEKVIVPRGSKGGGKILKFRATSNLNTYFCVG